MKSANSFSSISKILGSMIGAACLMISLISSAADARRRRFYG